MNKQVLIIGAVVAVLAIGAYLFWARPQTKQGATETVTAPVQTESVVEDKTSTQSSAVEAVKEITVSSGGLKFTPAEIKVKVGDKVRITYKNTKGQHNFALDEFNVKTKLLSAGEEETVEFVADKAGTYNFYCPVPGHRSAGMEGVLNVL